MKNKTISQVHLCTVDNNDEGRKFISELRAKIKQSKTGRKVLLYGRGHRFGLGRYHVNPDKTSPHIYIGDNCLQSSVPINGTEHRAQRIAVYILG